MCKQIFWAFLESIKYYVSSSIYWLVVKFIELQNDKKSCFTSRRPVEVSDSLINKVLLFRGKIAHKNPLSIISFLISINVYGPTLPSKDKRLWLIIFIVW